jgi:hypothetical protein
MSVSQTASAPRGLRWAASRVLAPRSAACPPRAPGCRSCCDTQRSPRPLPPKARAFGVVTPSTARPIIVPDHIAADARRAASAHLARLRADGRHLPRCWDAPAPDGAVMDLEGRLGRELTDLEFVGYATAFRDTIEEAAHARA